jgi:sodium transport system permease protein
MNSSSRIWRVYRKELLDILRDRRTLIAMILVPIVLYPLLTIGSIQAVSVQVQVLDEEAIRIGVLNSKHKLELLPGLLAADAAELERKWDALTPEEAEVSDLPTPITPEDYRCKLFASRENLERAVRERVVDVGFVYDRNRLVDVISFRNEIELLVDFEDVRSERAADRLREAFDRTADRLVQMRLDIAQLPPEFIDPIAVQQVDLSTPQSILGQILPLILVLMTITGAIYPAIDLTAGERERGTLESLMVCPVPVIDLIVGKFMVVATVAIMGATLNLGSMTATVYFGGFKQILASPGEGMPLGRMAFILVCMVPFAVLASALMMAVCSYARSFKEAQNYVTPLILAVLVPGGIAALPTSQLSGVMLVMPVGNMVLLARDVLIGAHVPWWDVLIVLASTTMYAGAAVAMAASVFGRESVVFADVGSFKAIFARGMIRPRPVPTTAMALILVCLLFPAWFFIQSSIQPGPGEDMGDLFQYTAFLMPLLFLALPVAVLIYWRIDMTETLRLQWPGVRQLLAGLLLGLSGWVLSHELFVLQHHVLQLPERLMQESHALNEALQRLDPAQVFFYLAIVPALCEEMFFRGFVLSGLRQSIKRPWIAIILAAMVFGAFHFLLLRFLSTTVQGILLGALCWRSRSIWPCMIAHALHNGSLLALALVPAWSRWLGVVETEEPTHLPAHLLIIGGIMFGFGLVLMFGQRRRGASRS